MKIFFKNEMGSAPAPGAIRRASRRILCDAGEQIEKKFRLRITGGRGVRRNARGARAPFFQLLVAALFLIGINASAISNNSLSDAQLLQIKFDQKLNSQISPDLAFRDSTGKQIQIGDYFGKRPIVLVLGYYGCPMLCTLVMNGAISTFQDLKWSAGENFDVMFVSIDPNETPQLAAAKRKNYLRSYGRGKPDGWHFLTGDKNSIQKLADEVGYRFAYDPRIKEYAHPSGLIILTPDGKVSRYLFGVSYSAAELNSALRGAEAKKIGSPIEQFVLLCFHYSPLTGKYGNLVMGVVRAGGILMMVALGLIIYRSNARKSGKHSDHKKQKHLAPAETNKL